MLKVLEPVAKKKPELVAFGLRLKAARQDAELSQEGLAELAGLHRVTIARMEAGLIDVSITTAGKLAAALGVEPDALLCPKK